MKSKNLKTPVIKKLDKMIKLLLFYRDHDTCQRCGRTYPYQLHPSHVISRSNKALRWDLNNLKVLCAHCHMWWHANPTESGLWFADKFPERMEYINKHRNDLGQYSVEDLKEMLEAFKQLAISQGIL
jgi:hypothetical protein